jgi:hypothetical protein
VTRPRIRCSSKSAASRRDSPEPQRTDQRRAGSTPNCTPGNKRRLPRAFRAISQRPSLCSRLVPAIATRPMRCVPARLLQWSAPGAGSATRPILSQTVAPKQDSAANSRSASAIWRSSLLSCSGMGPRTMSSASARRIEPIEAEMMLPLSAFVVGLTKQAGQAQPGAHLCPCSPR